MREFPPAQVSVGDTTSAGTVQLTATSSGAFGVLVRPVSANTGGVYVIVNNGQPTHAIAILGTYIDPLNLEGVFVACTDPTTVWFASTTASTKVNISIIA